MRILRIKDIEAKATSRPVGYYEETMKAGKIVGDFLHIGESEYNELFRKYRNDNPTKTACCGKKMPPVTKQLSNVMGAGKRVMTNLMTNQPIKANETTVNQREEICKQCSYCAPNGRCTLCGCFLAWKSKLLTETCPANKWPVVNK
jgi:hypothetical protein